MSNRVKHLKIALSERARHLWQATAVIGRADRALACSPALRWVAGALIIGAISFNAVLCFLNTRGVAISKVHVMMSEVLLISAALLACRNYLNFTHVSILALVSDLYSSAFRSQISPMHRPGASIRKSAGISSSRSCFFLLGQSR